MRVISDSPEKKVKRESYLCFEFKFSLEVQPMVKVKFMLEGRPMFRLKFTLEVQLTFRLLKFPLHVESMFTVKFMQCFIKVYD